MKSALFKDIFRELRQTRSRFISIMLMVALASMFLCGLRSAAPDMQLTAAWVRRGYGIGFIPEHAAKRLKGVAYRSVSPPLRFQVGLAYRKGPPPAVQPQRLIDYIQQRYPEYVHNEQIH